MCGICCCLYLTRENPDDHFKIVEESILPYLQRRGPDHVGKKEYLAQIAQRRIQLALVGTVLHLRGHKTPQPLEDDDGNVLLWNGEIFGGIQVEERENDSQVLLKALGCCPSALSPSQHVLLTMAKVQGPWSFIYWQPGEHKLWFGRDYFGRRSLLWHLPADSKDVFVITSVAERKSPTLKENLHMEEVPADGVYCVDCLSDSIDQNLEQPFRINKYDWRQLEDICGNNRDSAMFLACPVTPFNREIPTQEDLSIIDENRTKLSSQRNEMKNGEVHVIGERSDPVSHVTKVVEGNTVSLHCEDVEMTQEHDAKERNITRLQSDFGRTLSGFSSPDCFQPEACSSSSNVVVSHDCLRSEHLASLSLGPESKANKLSNCGNFGAVPESSGSTELPFCVSSSEKGKHSQGANLGPDGFIPQENMKSRWLRSQWDSPYRIYQEKFINILGDAVRKRVFNLPRSEADRCGVPMSSQVFCRSAKLTRCVPYVDPALSAVPLKKKNGCIGILFSGGIDSMMLAALADRFVPSEEPIDLVNVAFEQKTQTPNQNKNRRKRKENQYSTEECSSTGKERNFSVPDRVTGIAGLLELQSLNPSRQWNFIEVNVTIEELQEMRSRNISHLVSPLNTVLDDSIGCALWFAARGRGSVRRSFNSGGVSGEMHADTKDREYTTTAKVLLVGMGADEQLGGYARHRTRFVSEGWSGLMEEMEMDVRRISKRNLGRDDRCISDHGREARFPFLDEGVVSFLNSLPVWVKADPGLPRGTGEKLLLRQAARMLGLTSSSELPKRAIQFGSRIAKLESAGEKGSETCSRLKF